MNEAREIAWSIMEFYAGFVVGGAVTALIIFIAMGLSDGGE